MADCYKRCGYNPNTGEHNVSTIEQVALPGYGDILADLSFGTRPKRFLIQNSSGAFVNWSQSSVTTTYDNHYMIRKVISRGVGDFRVFGAKGFAFLGYGNVPYWTCYDSGDVTGFLMSTVSINGTTILAPFDGNVRLDPQFPVTSTSADYASVSGDAIVAVMPATGIEAIFFTFELSNNPGVIEYGMTYAIETPEAKDIAAALGQEWDDEEPPVTIKTTIGKGALTVTLSASLYLQLYNELLYSDFYLSKPEGKISVNLGETVLTRYTLVSNDGTIDDNASADFKAAYPSDNYSIEYSLAHYNITIKNSFVGTAFIVKVIPRIAYGAEELAITVTIYINNPNTPYAPGGTSGPGGGGGLFGEGEVSDDISIDIPIGSTEQSAVNGTVYTRLLHTPASLASWGNFLYSNSMLDAAVKELNEAIFGRLSDAIISLMSFPFDISQITQVSNQQFNFLGSSIKVAGQVIGSYGTIDWGELDFREYWGNFLDYSPHTKIELYLPWNTGTVSIDPNEVMNGSLKIVTNVEFERGTCSHIIYNNRGDVLGNYNGSCAREIPVTGRNTSGKMLQIATAAVGVAIAGVAGGMIGGTGGAAASAAGASSSGGTKLLTSGTALAKASYGASVPIANNPPSLIDRRVARSAGELAARSAIAAYKSPVHIYRNGSFTGTTAGMGIQYPYVIISRPEQSVPDSYGHHYGYPSNIYSSLGALRGYTEVGEIHLNGISATAEELAELDSILKGGVIL